MVGDQSVAEKGISQLDLSSQEKCKIYYNILLPAYLPDKHFIKQNGVL